MPDGLEVLVIALALVPGWLYLRLRAQVRPPSTAGGLSELLEVIAVGLLTTGASILMLTLPPRSWLPWFIDVQMWADQGDLYLRQNVRTGLISGTAVLALAAMIAYALHVGERRRSGDRFDPESSVWGKALGLRPVGTTPWAGVQLRDGLLVEGVLHSLSLGQEAYDERDIALTGPVRVTDSAGAVRTITVDRVVFPAREILYVTILDAPEGRR